MIAEIRSLILLSKILSTLLILELITLIIVKKIITLISLIFFGACIGYLIYKFYKIIIGLIKQY